MLQHVVLAQERLSSFAEVILNKANPIARLNPASTDLWFSPQNVILSHKRCYSGLLRNSQKLIFSDASKWHEQHRLLKFNAQ